MKLKVDINKFSVTCAVHILPTITYYRFPKFDKDDGYSELVLGFLFWEFTFYFE